MNHYALPFLTLSSASIAAGRWMLVDDSGEQSELGNHLDHWDYARNISLTRKFDLDFSAAARQLDIPVRQLQLGISVAAGTGTGTLPRLLITRVDQQFTLNNPSADISLHLEGPVLSGRLALDSVIYLASVEEGGPLSPKLAGAKLWRDRHDVQLEDGDPRFPIETVSFSRQFAGRPEEDALWYLFWSPSALHQEFSGNVRLYLNSDREDFVARMLEPDPVTIQTVLADLMCQMISTVILQDQIGEVLGTYESGTVGAQIAEWIARVFPGQSVDSVKETLTQRPGQFRAVVQANADCEGAGI